MTRIGEYLLDTNVVARLFKDDNQVSAAVRQANATYLSTIVLGELYFGALNSTRAAENLAKINAFASASSILMIDTETSLWYGQIRKALRATGRPIPDNDAWLAAAAIRHDLALVTYDKHFADIDRLTTVEW